MVKLQATGVLSDPSPTSALRSRHPDAARSEVLWLLSSGVVASAIVGSLLACGFCWLTIPAATNQTTEAAALPRRQFVLPNTKALIAPIQAAWAHDIAALAQPAILERTTTLLPSADAASTLEFGRSFAQCICASTANLCEQAALPHDTAPSLRKKPFFPNQASLTPPNRILSTRRAHLTPPKRTFSPRRATLTP